MIQITDYLLKSIEAQGVVLEDRDYVRSELDKALLDGCFSFITHDGHRSGFFTWVVDKDMNITVENLLVLKEYR